MKNVWAIILIATVGCVSTPPAGVEKLTTPMTTMLKGHETKSYSGGWGYSAKDAVVILAENELDGVGLEEPFLYIRSQAEVAAFVRKHGTKPDEGMPRVWTKQQSLRKLGGRKYDVLQIEVYVEFEDRTYLAYETECWFDITGFFGK